MPEPPESAGLPAGLWVVVAAYNEAERIGATLDGLLPHARSVVVVDDGSTDETAAEAGTRPVWVLRHRVNLGQGAALQTGIEFARGRGAEHIATFDADGQHDPADLAVLYRAMRDAEADYALGSRFLGTTHGMPLVRRLMLRSAIYFTWVLSGVLLSDAHNGIRVMTRRGAERIRITHNRMEHASELVEQIARSGLKYVEAPVTIRYSRGSLAKGQKTSAAARLAWNLLLEKTLR